MERLRPFGTYSIVRLLDTLQYVWISLWFGNLVNIEQGRGYSMYMYITKIMYMYI